MQNETGKRVYRPELIPRRGEWIAWIGTLLTGLTWLLLAATGQRVVVMIPVLFTLLLFSASIISLSNWMDRKTTLTLEELAVEYHNGLRTTRLTWDDIQEIRVQPGRWGEKVQVYADGRYFAFHTLGEVRMRGDLKGRMGFEKGEEILRQLVLRSGLHIVEQPGDGYTYARQ